jgi:hypothetical protein
MGLLEEASGGRGRADEVRAVRRSSIATMPGRKKDIFESQTRKVGQEIYKKEAGKDGDGTKDVSALPEAHPEKVRHDTRGQGTVHTHTHTKAKNAGVNKKPASASSANNDHSGPHQHSENHHSEHKNDQSHLGINQLSHSRSLANWDELPSHSHSARSVHFERVAIRANAWPPCVCVPLGRAYKAKWRSNDWVKCDFALCEGTLVWSYANAEGVPRCVRMCLCVRACVYVYL